MAKIILEKLSRKPLGAQSIEIVERKGRGHPDYVADAISEGLSLALCKYYREHFGAIYHHNVDKTLIVGGKSNPIFSGGEILEPIYIILAGRAVTQVKKGRDLIQVPIGNLVIRSVKGFLKENFRFLNPDEDVIVDYKIKQGSGDLVNIFNYKSNMPRANDTSFGVGFAPLTPTEKIALETEQYLNSEAVKKELPEIGEDIKVMALREKNNVKLTISVAMVSSLIPDASHYLNVKEEICRKVVEFVSKTSDLNLDVKVNAGDRPKKGTFYLTVTGTSAEQGDDGSTGRGNRINGLITPCRPMSLEAAAGKNPVNHVGKIYNVMAQSVADRVRTEVKGIEEVYVKILSQIGRPINEPFMSGIQLVLEKGYTVGNVSSEIKAVIREELTNVTQVTEKILSGEVTLY